MNDEIKEIAEKEGFEQGYFDGRHNFPKLPRPDINYEVLAPSYIKMFHEAYFEAYDVGKAEFDRLAVLRRSRTLLQDLDNEQDKSRGDD